MQLAKSESAKDALMVAVGNGQAKIVKCFIEHGVDVKSQEVANALKLAADNELWGVVKCFIDHGVDVKLEAAIDALIVAASHGRDDIVRCFIEHGVVFGRWRRSTDPVRIMYLNTLTYETHHCTYIEP